ncbi:hypothetical protein IEO21_09181 [Rhodonia placenta]|uniref:NUA/TPR/MLP1-2-like domain-containing protein n=1 Tax=Rhodonia placenta TaxID=104341 RepID=A0A8H7NUY4_9APHY|nr:hypothetical protein IEO21_09181 [Postia placenta]
MSGTPDLLSDGLIGLSPTVAMASRAQRGGKTFTEVYSDYVRLQEDYARKSEEFDNLEKTMAHVLAQLEERAPILSQQREEYERLHAETSQLASQLSQALSDRDAYAAASEENAQKFNGTRRENELLQKQLDDLGRQLRGVLRELGRVQDPSIPPDDVLDADENSQPPETIEGVIKSNLVLFRSIPQLQEQNQTLRKVVYELGAKLEAEEKDYREVLEKEQSEAVVEAHRALVDVRQQFDTYRQSAEVKFQSISKERDTLRAMLDRASTNAPPMVNGDLNGRTTESPPHSELERELDYVQNQFKAYQTEMDVDTVHLRDELLAAQRRAGQLDAALAKANAKIEFLNGEIDDLFINISNKAPPRSSPYGPRPERWPESRAR